MDKNKEELKVRKVHNIEERMDNELFVSETKNHFASNTKSVAFKNTEYDLRKENIGFQELLSFESDLNFSNEVFHHNSIIAKAGKLIKHPLTKALEVSQKNRKNSKSKKHSLLSKNLGKKIETLSCSARDLSTKLKASDFCLKF